MPGHTLWNLFMTPLSFKLGALFTFLGIIGCAVIYLFRRKPNNKRFRLEEDSQT